MEHRRRPGGVRTFAQAARLAALAAAVSLTGCAGPAADNSSTTYVTEYGLGPDKWATAWLLTRRVDPGSKLAVAAADEIIERGVRFDLPSAAIRRIGNRSAFQVARESFELQDRTLDALTEIITEIEVNYWASSGPAEARLVEDAFRNLQYRYGRDAVTPRCYVAFFERLYQVLRDATSKAIPVSVERLELSCEELTHLADRSLDLIPEVPVVDVLSAAAAGRRVVFVDVREADEYAEGHIPGALNIPIRDVSPKIALRLGEADYVVSYCVKDFRGFEMAKALAHAGVANSVIMRPYGIKGWVSLGLPVSGSKALDEPQGQQALRECLESTSRCLGEAAGP